MALPLSKSKSNPQTSNIDSGVRRESALVTHLDDDTIDPVPYLWQRVLLFQDFLDLRVRMIPFGMHTTHVPEHTSMLVNFFLQTMDLVQWETLTSGVHLPGRSIGRHH